MLYAFSLFASTWQSKRFADLVLAYVINNLTLYKKADRHYG
jgi:hypothetical protein